MKFLDREDNFFKFSGFDEISVKVIFLDSSGIKIMMEFSCSKGEL